MHTYHITNRRSIRYQIEVTYKDGWKEVIQTNSRRTDALRHAKSVANDRMGWPSIISAEVIDIMSSMNEHVAHFERYPLTLA